MNTPPEMKRFRRAMLTHQQPGFDRMDAKALACYPEVEAELGGQLLKIEMYGLATLLANMREIIELSEAIEELSK